MIAQSVSTHQRFRRYGLQCPICGGHCGMKQGKGERCAGYLSKDGEYVFCSRPEQAGNLELNEKTTPPTFCHKLYGACKCGKEHNPERMGRSGQKPRKQESKQEYGRIVAEYNYHNKQDRFVYQAVRYEPKAFKQRRPGEKGGWLWDMKGVTYVPYRLPELLKASPEALVYIVEGEKDVDTLLQRGLVATTNVGGAGNWQNSCTPYLKGRRVVILPDNDEKGEKHAQDVAKKLQGTARDARIVKLPGLPEKGDVSDWFAAGGTVAQLEAMCAPPKRKFTYASEVKEESIEWIWEGRIAKGEFTLGVGDAGIGKGLTCAAMIAMVTKIGGVIFMSPEDSASRTIVPRLKAAGTDLSKVLLLTEVDETDPNTGEVYQRPVSFPEDTPILREAMEDVGAVLVVIDPVLSMLSDKVDAYKNHAVRRAMSQVMKTAEKCKCAVLGIMHTTKSQHPNVLFRSSSSSAFIEMARTSLFFVADPDGEPGQSGVIVNYKNNLAKHASSLRYAIHQNEKGIGYIEWRGESRYSREELLNQASPTNNKKSTQELDLVALLKSNGMAMNVSEILSKVPNGQTPEALERMLRRKVEQGILSRPARGMYTYAGNPLYCAKTSMSAMSAMSDVRNVRFHEEVNEKMRNGHKTDIVRFENSSQPACHPAPDETDISDIRKETFRDTSDDMLANSLVDKPAEPSYTVISRECCNLNESSNGRFREHRAKGTIQDECGHWWCDKCVSQRDLINIACIRNWPPLSFTHHGREFTIEGGKRGYMAFAQLEGYSKVEATLSILEKEG